MKLLEEFKDFLDEFNVIALAVAFVIGIAVKDLSRAIVDGLIMPVVELVLPHPGWSDWVVSAGALHIRCGHVLARFLDFVLICFVVFLLVRMATGFKRKRRR